MLNSGVQSQLPSLLFVGPAFQVVGWLVGFFAVVCFVSVKDSSAQAGPELNCVAEDDL